MHMEQPRSEIRYEVSPLVSNEQLNELFAAAWAGHVASDFAPILARSLAYICAYVGERLVGYVNLAWDGGAHAFLLDTTVHPEWQRGGIGRALVGRAVAVARSQGLQWVHVDFEPQLRGFYASCGFQPTEAGLIRCEGRGARGEERD
jgi:GNAT superfamily N-acetyltransferase